MATYDVKQIALPGGDIANLKDGNAIHKSSTSGFVKNDGSIDQNTYQIAQEGKGLSTNDFTNEDKALIGQTLGNNTVLTTDKTPFLTRQTLNPTGFSGYVREKLVGASYAWNQLVQNGNFATTGSGWTTIRGSLSVSNNVGTFTSGAGSDNALRNVLTDYYIAGHKYLISFKYKSNVAFDFQPPIKADVVHCGITSNWTTVILLITNSTYAAALNTAYWYNYDSLTAGAWVLQLMEYQAIDLTLAFGSDMADKLYALANNGGITKLRDMGFPIDKYTPYGYGLYSVKTSGKKIVGKNLVEETITNATIGTDGTITTSSFDMHVARVLQGVTYTIKSDEAQSVSQQFVGGFFYSKPALNSVSYNGTRLANTSATFISPITGYVAFRTSRGYTVAQCEYGSSQTTYEPYSSTTYPLGNDELRGKFNLVNGEIVASGDVKESNGEIDRTWDIIDFGDLTWSRSNNGGSWSFYFFYANITGMHNSPSSDNDIVCSRYLKGVGRTLANAEDKSIITANNSYIYIRDDSYTDAATFKTAMTGQKIQFIRATPTTEQSTPFADPMSLVGATTEEYIDTRDIPCPVGAERQYMGQSEDVVEIPSMPQSDGKRVLVAETSGGKTQYYFEGDKNGAGTQINLMTYDTSSNKYVFPSDGYITLSNAGATVGDYIIMSVYGANDNAICGLRCDTPIASMITVQNLFVKRGMRCYIRAKSTGSFSALFTPLS